MRGRRYLALVANSLRPLMRFLRPYRWYAAGLIVLGIVASVFEAVSVSLMLPVLQALSTPVEGAPGTGQPLLDLLSRPFTHPPSSGCRSWSRSCWR